MRRFFPGVLTLMLAAMVASPVQAQITLIPRPQHAVSSSPEFVAAADFNGDSYQDLVVTNQSEDKVTILYGSGGSTFRSAVVIQVGQRVGRVAAGDVNGDKLPDIVTIDYNRRRFYVIFNEGNGFYKAPAPFDLRNTDGRATGVRPTDVAIGRFNDDKIGNPPVPLLDLGFVAADYGGQRADRIFMVRTKLGNDFDSANPVPFAVGDRPRRIILHDMNDDGFDDALVLNTGDSNTDDLAVLINKAIPQGDYNFPPIRYVVGIQAVDLAVADVNNDGLPDVLVLADNRRGANNGEFTVSVLVNIPTTRASDGKIVGSGAFNILAPTDKVTCPTSLEGIPIVCTPTTIITGDFDSSGRTDYAVSFRTVAVNAGDGRTGGLVISKVGLGNGVFDLATSVAVGFNPEHIVPADFNGDGIDDIGVAEHGSKTVRILEAVKPPEQADGAPCLVGSTCISGNCVDGVCCATASCPAGMKCDVPGHAGMCSAPNQNGGECTEPEHCASGNCVDNFCCEQRSCPTGEFCNTGMCAPPAGNGSNCNQDEQCASGNCVDGVCCSNERCPADQSCNVPGFEGMCHERLPNGDTCIDDLQCLSTHCTEGVCCEVDQCQVGFSCALPNREGRCVAKPTPTPTRTFTNTPTLTPTPAPIGRPCIENSHCISNFCVDNTCCESPICPQFQRCDITGNEGMCKPQVPEGGQCGKDSDCISDNCTIGNPPVCGPRKTPTRTPTPTPKPRGDTCASTSQCEAGFFCEEEEKVCCDQLNCPSGSSCRVPGQEGSCVRLIPTPTPKRSAGTPCSDPIQCLDGLFCTHSTCCTDATCPEGQRCDITGFKGSCSLPNGVDAPCDKNSDCSNGLICTVVFGGARQCQPPPSHTPDRFPTNTPQPTAGVTVSNERKGGCAMDERGDGGAAWLLVTLPLIGWMRRTGMVRIGK